MKKIIFAAFLSLGISSLAFADSIQTYTITVPNSDISGDVGPYATVTVDLTSAKTATITFNSLTNGGYIYLLGAENAFDVNVNATTFTETTPTSPTTLNNSLTGFSTPSVTTIGSGNVSSFGTFNLTFKLFDGFTHTVDTASFVLTDTSGTWASASNVLIANADGYAIAMHAFPCAEPGCTGSSSAAPTGFAAGSLIVPAPEPRTWLLLGSTLLGTWGWLAYKNRRRVRS